MTLDPFKLVEPIADYLSFWLAFVANPWEAFKPYQGAGSVQKAMVLHVIIGVIVSWLIYVTARAIGTAQDPSLILSFLGRLASKLTTPVLGLVAILVIFLLTVILHGLASVWLSIERFMQDGAALSQGLGGSIGDSINASFGFMAFFLPLVTLGISTVSIVALYHPPTPTVLLAVISLTLAGLILFYFPAALSAAHPNTSLLGAWRAFSVAIVFSYLLLTFLKKVL